MKNIKSPHDINSYASFVLQDGSIEVMNSLLLAVENSNRNISIQVSWHITENCHAIVMCRHKSLDLISPLIVGLGF